MGDLFDDLYDIVRGTHIDLMDMGGISKGKRWKQPEPKRLL